MLENRRVFFVVGVKIIVLSGLLPGGNTSKFNRLLDFKQLIEFLGGYLNFFSYRKSSLCFLFTNQLEVL